PYPARPNNSAGTVPRTIVTTPLLPPNRTANSSASATWPFSASSTTTATTSSDSAAMPIEREAKRRPIALKDLLHVKDRVTTAGSKSWHGRVATETATAVEKLIAAGMIPLGKTHM